VTTPETCRAVIRLNKKYSVTTASSWNYIPDNVLFFNYLSFKELPLFRIKKKDAELKTLM
jgi:hypothetical protein